MIIAMIAAAIVWERACRISGFLPNPVLAGLIFRNPILQALWKTALETLEFVNPE
jgi:hypothetical protein